MNQNIPQSGKYVYIIWLDKTFHRHAQAQMWHMFHFPAKSRIFLTVACQLSQTIFHVGSLKANEAF